MDWRGKHMEQKERKPKVALIVGSGGIKPLGLSCFFRFLEQNHLKPDLIIGCSGGSILSSYWASGFSADYLDAFTNSIGEYFKTNKMFDKIDYRTLLSLGNYPGGKYQKSSGILSNKVMVDFLKTHDGDKPIENNLIKTILMATDLETGEQVTLQQGNMAECIYASCALYPLLPPIHLNNRWLVDGAYFSAVPVMEAVKQGYDKIIAISFEDKEPEHYSSFFEFYLQFISQVLNKNARKQNSLAIHLHHDEILFMNISFDKLIRFWDVTNLSYVKKVTEEILEKYKSNIISMFH